MFHIANINISIADLRRAMTARTLLEAVSTESRLDSATKLVFESIDEALIDLFGNRPRQAAYDFMERNHGINRSEIPNHLDQFFGLFERVFGIASKKVIGRAIAKRMYAKLGLGFKPIPYYEFSDYLERVRFIIEALQRAKSATNVLPLPHHHTDTSQHNVHVRNDSTRRPARRTVAASHHPPEP